MLSATDSYNPYINEFADEIKTLKTLQETYEKIAMALEPRQFPLECGIKEIYRTSREENNCEQTAGKQ
jgi:hypothetical protein